MAIDIPIGLPTVGHRECDRTAAALLGPRRNSVFPVPPRAVVETKTYDQAWAVSSRLNQKKISKQSFALFPKIREVDAELRGHPDSRLRVREVHPELCFAQWNQGMPMEHSTGTGFGFLERFRLVEPVFGSAPADVRRSTSRNDVEDDDILDAFAALWTAERIESSNATVIGSAASGDDLPMQMWS